MPNHCENDLRIYGNQADRDALLELMKADRVPVEFDFNAFIPYPERFRKMDEEHRDITEGLDWLKPDNPNAAAQKVINQELIAQRMDAYKAKWGTTSDGYNSGGYEWCIANWDTKWGAYRVSRKSYKHSVLVCYRTAWSPSLAIIDAMAARFPRLRFYLRYFEGGMGYQGVYEVRPIGGEPTVTRDSRSSYRGSRGG